MIKKEEVIKIAEQYLKTRKRSYTNLDSIDKVQFYEKDKNLYGKRKGEEEDVYVIGYGVIWGNEERSMIIHISANTGEVLYTMSPHGWVEEIEDDKD